MPKLNHVLLLLLLTEHCERNMSRIIAAHRSALVSDVVEKHRFVVEVESLASS